MLLAVWHVTQGIWLSHGGAWPGDLGDGRFNQFVMEHGYQSIRGVYAWDSPGQFYPTVHTLGYSDTHAGTLPLYAALRWLGYSMDHAWQGWFMLVAALNFIACVRLFGAWRIARVLRGPLAFAAVGAVTMMWFAGTHMQMLPVFAALLGWDQLVRWTNDRAPWRLIAATGWLIWQFCAGPYAAFFAVILILPVGLLWAWPGSSGQRTVEKAKAGGLRPWIWTLIPAALAAIVGAMVGRIYLGSVQAGAGRPLNEVIDLAPRLQSWFGAAPVSVLYGRWLLPAPNASLSEHALFAGFLPWLVLPVAAVLAWRWRRTELGRWLLALAGGVLAVAVFFTCWGGAGTGLWIALSRQFPALCAFRATGRVVGLLHVAQIALIGLVLTAWLARAKTLRARLLPAALAGLTVFEGLAFHQPVVVAAEAKARAVAVAEAWQRAGDRPVLAYAPGYTNQPEVWLNLDAWGAALRLGRKTLNGYSGGGPASHTTFLWNLTAGNARALMRTTVVPENEVSLVETVGPVAERAMGLQRQARRNLAYLEGFDLQPVNWDLAYPVEMFQLEGQPMYQFTPPAEVRFDLPDAADRIDYRQALRPGAYTDTGHSDGVGVTWVVRQRDGTETAVWHEYFNPRDQPKDRGIVDRQLQLLPGRGRVLILRVDVGPAGNPAWDWPVFGRLRAR